MDNWIRPLTDKEADIYNSQIEQESISTGLELSKSELSESEKELQDKIDAMTATLYSQLGIAKESFVGTATDRYLQATARYLQTTDLRGAVPAADVQPIVYAHKTINVGRRSYCSNCGKLAIMEDFCSKCGAKVKDGDTE